MGLLNVMRGEPFVTKLAAVAKFAVLPGAMIAALIYSPPDYALWKKPQSSASKYILKLPSFDFPYQGALNSMTLSAAVFEVDTVVIISVVATFAFGCTKVD